MKIEIRHLTTILSILLFFSILTQYVELRGMVQCGEYISVYPDLSKSGNIQVLTKTIGCHVLVNLLIYFSSFLSDSLLKIMENIVFVQLSTSIVLRKKLNETGFNNIPEMEKIISSIFRMYNLLIRQIFLVAVMITSKKMSPYLFFYHISFIIFVITIVVSVLYKTIIMLNRKRFYKFMSCWSLLLNTKKNIKSQQEKIKILENLIYNNIVNSFVVNVLRVFKASIPQMGLLIGASIKANRVDIYTSMNLYFYFLQALELSSICANLYLQRSFMNDCVGVKIAIKDFSICIVESKSSINSNKISSYEILLAP